MLSTETQKQPSWGDAPYSGLQGSHNQNIWKSHHANTQHLQQNPEADLLFTSFAQTALAFRVAPEVVANAEVNVLMVPSRGTWVQHTALCQQTCSVARV